MARVLVTGASGLLGANLVLTISEQHSVVAVCHQHWVDFENVGVVAADLGKPGAAQSIMQSYKPEWVVHCAAASHVDSCEEDPNWAFRLNKDMATYVAHATREVGASLIHISTDAVFDGWQGDYQETEEPNPINVYGESKWAGERAVAEAHPGAIIVRTNFYGWNVQPKLSLAEWFLERLERGETCQGFTDVWVTTMLVNDLALILVRMLEAGLKGTYHVVGSDCMSKYEFGLFLADIFDLDGKLIEPIPVEKLNLSASRPKRICLNGEKVAQALQVDLPSVIAGLRRFRRLREGGYPDRLRSLMRREP
ncbi:MAG: sugar nucleotide-binding protein [Anaerolineales bacterium]|nr:sugar nucleotide-binding protein [Anaerolineales bacterium]